MIHPRWRWGLFGLLLAAAVAAAGLSAGRAADTGQVGYVDVNRIIDEYLRRELDPTLQEETRRLQQEFDREAEGLEDEAKAALFNQYQAQLNQFKQDLVDERLPRINEAIGQVAAERGLALVLEKQVVLFGGINLTDEVLQQLGGS